MGLPLLLWLIICFSPALLEFKNLAATASWGEASGALTSVRIKPVDKTNGLLDQSVISYQYTVGGEQVQGETTSLPHLAYFSHFPTELKDDFKTGSVVKVRYNPENTKETLLVTAANQFMVTACAEAVLVFIAGAVLLLIWSVTKSAM